MTGADAGDDLPPPEPSPVAVRAYAPLAGRNPSPARYHREPRPGPSEWVLVFDCETTTDAAQQLRFGTYQVRRAGELEEAGVFDDPLSLSENEAATLRTYAETHGLVVRTTESFVDGVFFPVVDDRRGTCVGFNLPFDLSRLAVNHAPARGRIMRGGFSFQLSANKRRPRIQVKHLNSRAALIRFTAPSRQRTPRGMRRWGLRVPVRRGFFTDVKTLGTALTGQSHDLASLARVLGTSHQKLATDEHGGSLTIAYLEYALGDVQVTWECFERLQERYESYGLTRTASTAIYSEASIGKACLREMGIRPWRDCQPRVPPDLLGIILSTYYGGRSEVHQRRVVARVLYCDFLSMYPTVCTLMRLWRFVIARRIAWRDVTGNVQALLDRIGSAVLQNPATWRSLCVLVQVQPNRDLFPVRARYGTERQYSIGLNHLTSDRPLWFTLADCIASALLTGKPPRVIRAIRFEPVGVQAGLGPLDIMGNPAYRADPYRDDFYRRLIDLRTEVKDAMATPEAADDTARAAALHAEQLALKITANATSYGIFVELNVREGDRLQEVTCYGPDGQGFSAWARNDEDPGRCFHPLLATLITGAARLMLALAEYLATEAGITWAFCDTDSMALTQPKGMEGADFLGRARQVRDWFTPLNTYAEKGPLFQIEDANYRIEAGRVTGGLAPLYCYAVSAKRYALFNVDAQGHPVLRKASAHGLGHLRPPYTADQTPGTIPEPVVPLHNIGVDRWQYDLWCRIVQAALDGHPVQVPIADLPGFGAPAVSRYAATTPALLRWFTAYNRGKPYREQVRPFNFLLAFQTDALPAVSLEPIEESNTAYDSPRQRSSREPIPELPRAVAPYNPDPVMATQQCFDRTTKRPVVPGELKSYLQALAQYHLHPEAKFGNADYTDAGGTVRRHIVVTAVEHIGKEANRWEEQLCLGEDPEAQIEYGTAPEDLERMRGTVLRAAQKFGQRALAKAAGVSLREVSAIVRGHWKPVPETLVKLVRAIPQLEAAYRRQVADEQAVLTAARERCQKVSLRQFARAAGVDWANLADVLSSKRKPSKVMMAKLRTLL
jgi:hypothetical protein